MYQSVVFQYLPEQHNFMDEEVRNLFLNGFQKQSETALPLTSEVRNGAFLSFNIHSLINYTINNVLFLEYRSQIRWPDVENIIFPTPVINIVSPIFNYVDNQKYLFKLQEYHIRSMILTVAWRNQIPLSIICINDEYANRFANFEDPNWWKNDQLEGLIQQVEEKKGNSEVRRRYEFVQQNLKVVECRFEDLPDFPEILLDKINITYSKGDRTGTKQSLPYVLLDDIQIGYDAIGLGKYAARSFAINCIEGLILKHKAFKIWVDSAKRPNINTQRLRYFKITEDRANWLFFGNIPFAKPNYEHEHSNSNFGNLAAAYHIYLELDGRVHDSLVAFNQSIPLGEYQAKLSSSWRKSFEVFPTTTIDEALAALDALIEQAKYQV